MMDDHRLTLQLLTMHFPTMDQMRDGTGEIQLDFNADTAHEGRHRRFTLKNHHQSRISSYQVNALVPLDPDIQITA
jgi:hypothetical protein